MGNTAVHVGIKFWKARRGIPRATNWSCFIWKSQGRDYWEENEQINRPGRNIQDISLSSGGWAPGSGAYHQHMVKCPREIVITVFLGFFFLSQGVSLYTGMLLKKNFHGALFFKAGKNLPWNVVTTLKMTFCFVVHRTQNVFSWFNLKSCYQN